MKFSQYILSEENKVEDLDKLFNGEFKYAYHAKLRLYRGRSASNYKKFDDQDYEIQDSSKFNNIKRDPKLPKYISWDVFQMLVPNWKDFPNRDKSIFFTNKKAHAAQFGKICYVFPCNNAIIAAASADFNYLMKWPVIHKLIGQGGVNLNTMKDFIFTLATFIESPEDARKYASDNKGDTGGDWLLKNKKRIQDFLDKITSGKDRGTATDWRDVVHEKFQEYMKHFASPEKKDKFYKYNLSDLTYIKILMDDFGGDLDKFFVGVFDPYENEFEVIKTHELDSIEQSDEMEFWTVNRCLIVPEPTFDNYEKKNKK